MKGNIMYTNLVHCLIFILHAITFAVINKRHNDTEEVVTKLYEKHSIENKQLEDNITSAIEQMSVSFDTKLEDNLRIVREEIEVDLELINVLNTLVKDREDGKN